MQRGEGGVAAVWGRRVRRSVWCARGMETVQRRAGTRGRREGCM